MPAGLKQVSRVLPVLQWDGPFDCKKITAPGIWFAIEACATQTSYWQVNVEVISHKLRLHLNAG
jgi:hypothetical protein